ncbi:AraC family transcriptional regulator (plasmid) [Rhizobium sp. 32-5/1]|uniref:helix-turn-helix domain-containing protein n=1 Tax=Rhizobium sp. 32-5/1 TaxID=3019602 RepID=UPI00240E31CA|nr:AraC family transcriptional regulator [Rhizobium sp. 32-5/1]WEZ85608.1 AraC family transcriptional regulator [Rhizobium sp. 32-5/1]
MQAVLIGQAYQAESATEAERKRHWDLFRTSIVAFRLRTRKLAVEPHTGGFSLKTVFSGLEAYELNDRAASVVPGEVLLVRQNEVYSSSIATAVETDSFSLFFPFEFYRQEIAEGRSEPLRRFLDSAASSVSLPVNSKFSALLRRVATQLEVTDSKLLLGELVAQLQMAIGGHVEDVVKSYARISMRIGVRKADRLRRLMRAREMLHDDLGRDVTLADLAAEACMSEFHLLRCFTEAFAVPPSRYLDQLRMERARELLGSSRLPVKVVADRVGYTNFSAFCRSFGRATGMTPRMFRNEYVNTLCEE